MVEALDSVVVESSNPKNYNYTYLKKSLFIYKVYGALLGVLVLILFFGTLGMSREIISEGVTVLTVTLIISFWVANVLGCIYSWKIYKRGEGSARMRLKYVWLHLVLFPFTVLSCIGLTIKVWEFYNSIQY